MKKTILILICLYFTSFIYAGWFDGMVKIDPKLEASLLRASGDMNAIKNGMQTTNGDISGIKSDIGKVLEANIKITNKLDLNLQAVAGFNNQLQNIKNTAGRDVNQTTNDTKLMTYIISGLTALCFILISTLGWCLRTLIKRDTEKRFYKERTLININSEEDLKKLRTEHDNYIKNGGRKNEKVIS